MVVILAGVLSPLRYESVSFVAERRATHSTTCLYSVTPSGFALIDLHVNSGFALLHHLPVFCQPFGLSYFFNSTWWVGSYFLHHFAYRL